MTPAEKITLLGIVLTALLGLLTVVQNFITHRRAAGLKAQNTAIEVNVDGNLQAVRDEAVALRNEVTELNRLVKAMVADQVGDSSPAVQAAETQVEVAHQATRDLTANRDLPVPPGGVEPPTSTT